MPFPLLPVVLNSAYDLATGVKRIFKKSKGMNMTRQRIYDAALTSLKPSDKLRTLAGAFRAEKLDAQADMLEKRAALKELPDSIRAARKAALKTALTWTDPAKVRKLAVAFDDVGSTGAAALLRRYAAGLVKQPKPAVPTASVRRRRPISMAHDEPEETEESHEAETEPGGLVSVQAGFDPPEVEEIEAVRTELEIEPVEPTPDEPPMPNSGISSTENAPPS